MIPLAGFVQITAHDLCPAQARLPPLIWSAFTAFNQVHSIWRWYRRAELYRNPDNFSQLLAGHAINRIFGDVFILRVAAQCLLIATRILQCVQQQASLYREGERFIDALSGRFPAPVSVFWTKEQKSGWLSPSTVHWWKITSGNLWNRIARIAFCALHFGKKAFTLSMLIMDAADAFYLSPSTRNEGIHEGFVNVIKWLNTIVDQKEELLAGISQNREIIEKIIDKSPFTYTQLHDTVARALGNAEGIHHHVDKIAAFGNGIILDFGKRALNGGMVVAGLANYRPEALGCVVN